MLLVLLSTSNLFTHAIIPCASGWWSPVVDAFEGNLGAAFWRFAPASFPNSTLAKLTSSLAQRTKVTPSEAGNEQTGTKGVM